MAINPKFAEALLLFKELAETVEAPQSITLGELWHPYWETEARHLKRPCRVKDAWAHVKDIVGDDGIALKDRPAISITAEVVEGVRSHLKNTPTKYGKPPKPGTMNVYLLALRRILQWGVENRKLRYNPLVLKLEVDRNVKRTAIRREEEFQKLMSACDPIMRALVLIYFDGGLRRQEGLGLRRDQIMRKADGSAVAFLSGSETKTGRPRTPRLTKRTVEALDALPDRGQFFFASPKTGRPYDASWIYRKFCAAVAQAGLQAAPGENMSPHVLRHSFAYMRRAVDHWPRALIMAQGGWTTDSCFRRYGDPDDGEIDRAMETLEERLRSMAPLKRTQEFPPIADEQTDAEIPTSTKKVLP